MPPFRQRFPVDEPPDAQTADGWTLVQPASQAPATNDGWTLVQPVARTVTDVAGKQTQLRPSDPSKLPKRPVSAEDFTSSSSAPVADAITGFVKAGLHSALDIGDTMSRAGLIPGSTPALPNPTIQAMREATPYRNTAERLGGGIETAAELAMPAYDVGKAGVALAREAPAVLRKAAPALAEVAKTGASELAAHYLGGLPFGSGTAARIILKTALDSARKAAPEAAAEVSNIGGRLVAGKTPTFEQALTDALADLRTSEAPARITTPPQPDLPRGYQPRTTVPSRRPMRAPTSSPAVSSPEIPSRVPFDVADPATIDRLPQEADLSKPTLERVPLKDLVATQEGLTPDVVRQHLEHPSADLAKVPARAVGRFDPDAVTVIRGADGRNYLSGGTHRATAAFLKGEPDIQAIVYPTKASVIPAAVAEKVPAAVRPYFLKSSAQMADEAAAQLAPRSTPTGSLDVSDLPASWRTHTGQDLFPLKNSVETDAVQEFQRELQDQGMSVSEAIASVSKNREIPVQLRSRLLSVLMKTRPH